MAAAYMNMLHRWNSRICPPMGFLLNVLLIWLILRRTPKEMRVHSRILLQTCLLDIGFLVTMLFGTVFFIQSTKDEIVIVYNGWLLKPFESALGSTGLVWHDLVCLYLYYTDVFGISVQFVYRYLVLNRNMHIGLLRYLLMLSVVAIGVFMMTLSIHGYSLISFDVNSLAKNPNDTANMMNDSFDWDDQELSVYFVQNVTMQSQIWLYIWTFLYISTYTIIIFCAWRMNRFLNAHANFNANLKTLNKQLTLNLIILASIPVLLGSLDIGLTYYYQMLKMNNSSEVEIKKLQLQQSLRSIAGLQLIANLAAMWVPSLNALVSILVNKPYYRTAMSFFFGPCCCCQKQPNQVVPAAAVVVRA